MTQFAQESMSEVVSLQRTFSASAERLFSAWTDPKLLLQWWGPVGSQVKLVEVDLREGGKYRIGILQPNGEVYHVGGVYEEIRPSSKLAFTWRWEQPEMDIGNSLVTILFEEHDNKTEMFLTHAKLPNEVARTHHREGWVSILQNLDGFLES